MHALKSTTKIVAISAFSLLLAGLPTGIAWAHPGHGVGGGDWSMHHYLTEPAHLVGALGLAILFAGTVASRAIRVRKARRVRR